jgi:molybdate/tungstate transport system substrate-binding protein
LFQVIIRYFFVFSTNSTVYVLLFMLDVVTVPAKPFTIILPKRWYMRVLRFKRSIVGILVSLLIFINAISAFAETEGDLIIYHAGSLTVPLKKMINQFNSIYPEVKVVTKAGGSTKMARLISEKGEIADIMASADYKVIDDNLIPRFADWNIRFATNRLVLCYTDKSRMGDTINAKNWHEILRKPRIRWGHSDPNLDPCGYRSLMVMQLAEKHYQIDGLYEKLLANRPPENVKTKAVELVELLKSGDLDYGWEYLSVAVQHGLKFVDLDDDINLGNYQYDDTYATAKVNVTGKKPGTFIEKKGKSITYGVTKLKNAPHQEAADAFLVFMLSKENGLHILDSMGQPPFIPARVTSDEMKAMLPPELAAVIEVRS